MNNNNYIRRVNIYKKEMPIWLVSILKTLLAIFLVMCIAVAIFNFTHIGTPVLGTSMVPTLNNYDDYSTKDYVYINRFSSFSHGDIIVINNPEETENKTVIKRVIAMEGDKISVVRNVNSYYVYIIKNGETTYRVLKEPYLASASMEQTYLNFEKLSSKNLSGGEFSTIDGIKFLTIKEGYVFYLGDNRNDSKDCSYYGPIQKSKVVGKVDIIVYENKNHISYIFNYYINKFFG